jgi:hypothetical protein
MDSVNMHATATAGMIRNVGGFKIPETGELPPILPITVDEDDWDDVPQIGVDDWTWNPATETIESGPDGIPELVLFPQGNSAGNYGTVNVGISSNSTPHIARQIREGLNQSDLDYHGGELKLQNGELTLSGNTGITASLKDDLMAVAGQPRIVPLYEHVTGQGNTTSFRIVKWAGIRIMHVKLTGTSIGIQAQPVNVRFKGVIQGEPGEEYSNYVFSQPYLIK